jgi:hypothetical protein
VITPGKIAHRIERQLAVETGHGGKAAVGEQQRVAVRARARGRLHADDAAGAAAIVDDDSLAEIRRQCLAEHARHRIHRPARRKRHDETDGAVGVGGAGWPRQQRGAGEAGESGQITARYRHGKTRDRRALYHEHARTDASEARSLRKTARRRLHRKHTLGLTCR